jgi:hypothetical protein
MDGSLARTPEPGGFSFPEQFGGGFTQKFHQAVETFAVQLALDCPVEEI